MAVTQPFNAFTSERLVYRAVDDTLEDEAFVHSIQRDAEAQSGASYGLLRPESKKDSNVFKQHIAEKCLLGAIVYLPPTPGDEMIGEPVGIICLKANPPYQAYHRWSDISIDILRKYRVRLYEKFGFKLEGKQRDHMWFNGGWHDNVIFGILENEWRELKKA
ncbi:putative GNAT family acetyltransferase [Whalleya microplaca]|nr:putative GNAT family acetyltransferase [Whalleya microplaca]